MANRRKQQQDRGGDADLEVMVQGGQSSAYEALQIYRSRSNRAKVKGDWAAAIATAARGARLLCGQYAKAGLELAIALVDLLVESGGQWAR